MFLFSIHNFLKFLRREFERRYRSFPRAIQNKLKQLTGQSEEELINEAEYHDREIQLAINAHRCSQGRKKMVVHAGVSHSPTVNNPSLRAKYEESKWYPTSIWHKLLAPSSRFTSVANVTTNRRAESIPAYASEVSSYSDMESMVNEISMNMSCGANGTRLLSRSELSRDMQNLLGEGAGAYDSFIFGPTSPTSPGY